MAKPNIIIEAIFLNLANLTGIERHFILQLELFEKGGFFNRITIVTKNDMASELLPKNLSVEIIKVNGNSKEEWRRIYSTVPFDIVYSTFVPPAVFPPHGPLVYVLHDPGRYIYPEFMDMKALAEHMMLFAEYVAIPQFLVVTVSKASLNDILHLFPSLQDKVYVVHNFISSQLQKLQRKAEPLIPILSHKSNFFLTIGCFIPTKNTLSIVKAFALRSEIFADFQLIIVGRKGWYNDLYNYLADNKHDNILAFDYIDNSQLLFLYKKTYGFISASLYEGFGLPLIEAAYFNCPRIFCSDIPPYREINIDNVVYFNPNDERDIADKVFTNSIAPHDFEVSASFSCEVGVRQFKAILDSAERKGYLLSS